MEEEKKSGNSNGKESKSSSQTKWSQCLFQERNRILEFYVATVIAFLAGFWVLRHGYLCPDWIETILLLVALAALHTFFFLFFKIISARYHIARNAEQAVNSKKQGNARNSKAIHYGGVIMIPIVGCFIGLLVFMSNYLGTCQNGCACDPETLVQHQVIHKIEHSRGNNRD